MSYSAAKYWMFSELHKYVPVKVLVLLLVMPVLFAETLIVRPYAEALRSTRKIPTKEMHLVDCEEVRFAVSLLIAELADLARLSGSLADFGKDRYPATSKKKAKIERGTREAACRDFQNNSRPPSRLVQSKGPLEDARVRLA